MISPYKGIFRVSQAYRNKRRDGTLHQGYDLVGITDKRLFSPVYGVVERAGWEAPWNHKQGFGLYVRIRIGDTGYRMYFGHMAKIFVKVGQVVKPGDMIGTEGNTGHSTGSHCHWEIRKGTAKRNYISIANYADIPNYASGNHRQSGWGAELLGTELLRNGRNDSPCRFYNSVVQQIVGVKPDGLFGSNTTNAVRHWQSAHGLKPDGLVGNDTKKRMMGE